MHQSDMRVSWWSPLKSPRDVFLSFLHIYLIQGLLPTCKTLLLTAWSVGLSTTKAFIRNVGLRVDAALLLEHLPDVGKALGSSPSTDRNEIDSRRYRRPPEAEPASSLAEGDQVIYLLVRA